MKIFAFTFFLCMFALQIINDCFSQPRNNHKYTGNKNIAHVRSGESPFYTFRNFGCVGCLHPDVGALYCSQTITLERIMQTIKREERFEGRGEPALSPHQTAAVHALLSVIDKETIQTLDDLFLGYLASDLCDCQGGVQRSSTGFQFLAFRSFLVTVLSTPSPLSMVANLDNGLNHGLNHSAQEGEQV